MKLTRALQMFDSGNRFEAYLPGKVGCPVQDSNDDLFQGIPLVVRIDDLILRHRSATYRFCSVLGPRRYKERLG